VEERHPTKVKKCREHVESAARWEGRTPAKMVIEANSPDVKMTRMLTESTNSRTVVQSRRTARRTGIVELA
jgi:hypothetical protein